MFGLCLSRAYGLVSGFAVTGRVGEWERQTDEDVERGGV